MKKFLLATVLSLLLSPIALAGSFNNSFPLPGNSICSTRLQVDTVATITPLAQEFAGNSCSNYQVTNTQILKNYEKIKETSTGKTWGMWAEVWTVRTCNRSFDVVLAFKNDVYGGTGTDFYVLNADEILQKAQK